jgi:hypothetical protein
MAGFTCRDAVHADQREAGKVVIEKDLVIPAGFGVTIVTAFSLFALMHVICPMTIHTFRIFDRLH